MLHIKKISTTPELEIHENTQTGFKSLFAAKNIEEGIVLSKIDFEKMLNAPDKYSVQIGENQHVVLKPDYLKFINHSCNPNVFFDLNRMEIRTLREIKSGEEIAFFYPSTEWKMTEPFDCLCGSSNCLTRIAGAYNLSSDSFRKYQFSDFVLQRTTANKL